MKHKITKEDKKKLRKAEREEYIEHNLVKKKCICANCQIIRFKIQCGYWHKKYRDKLKEIDEKIVDVQRKLITPTKSQQYINGINDFMIKLRGEIKQD